MHSLDHVPVVVPEGCEAADEPPQGVGWHAGDVGRVVAVAAQQLVDRQVELGGQFAQPGFGLEGRQGRWLGGSMLSWRTRTTSTP